MFFMDNFIFSDIYIKFERMEILFLSIEDFVKCIYCSSFMNWYIY